MTNIKLSKEATAYLSNFVKSCNLITKWSHKESIGLMRTFFANPSVNEKSISFQQFMSDGFDTFLPIVNVFLTDMFDTDFIKFLNCVSNNVELCRTYGLYDSYAQAQIAYHKYKKSILKEAREDNNDSAIRGLNIAIGGGQINFSQPSVEKNGIMSLILAWPDIFKSTVAPRIVAACDYILKNCVDHSLVDSDLANKKFPNVVEFFNLDKNAAEICKFCFIFRVTNIKLPRDVTNFESRMTQVSEMTGVPVNEITKYAAINRKDKQFIPFVVETCALQENVWSYLANERSDNLEECFYKIINLEDTLPQQFFDKIDKDNTDTIISIINGDKTTKRPRHILLYGKPGTGKTSYMKMLCELSGRRGYSIAQAKVNNDIDRGNQVDTSVESRFMSLTLCDERIDSKKSLIVVDEADEMINCVRGFSFFGGSSRYDTKIKSLLNQVMDNTETPVIWITNNQSCAIDPSCRRRFDYSVFFDDFNETQRKLIWKNNVEKFKLGKLINEEMQSKLAEQYAITPGGIASACRALIDINPNKKNVYSSLEKVLEKHCELLEVETKNSNNTKFKPCKQYSLTGLNIESSLPIDKVASMCKVYLTKKENGEVDRAFSMLFSGPSGTGKTECVKYLGSLLNKQVHVVHASSVLDMYVGNTEKHIAAAFKKAEADNAILFMDEVDGLLSGREKSQHSWEISQVNEILCQMENFRGIFIAASNFADNVDSASVRRFTFKFKFDYLKEAGINAFFERYFWKLGDKDEYAEQICNLRNVAPGDFALVKMLAEYTDEKIDSKWIYDALKRELNAKKSNSAAINAKPKNIGY